MGQPWQDCGPYIKKCAAPATCQWQQVCATSAMAAGMWRKRACAPRCDQSPWADCRPLTARTNLGGLLTGSAEGTLTESRYRVRVPATIRKLSWFGQCPGLVDPSVDAPVCFGSFESVVHTDPEFLSGAREEGIELSGCRHDGLMPVVHRPRPPESPRGGWARNG